MSKKKLVIAVDFNGTCVTYCYPEGTGEDIGAVPVLKRLLAEGHQLVLMTGIERETTAAHTADPSVPVRTVAEESDLTTDRLNWVLGATIGVKFSKQFSLSKQAQKVKMVATDTAIPNDDEPAQGGNSGDTGGGNQQGGGLEP